MTYCPYPTPKSFAEIDANLRMIKIKFKNINDGSLEKTYGGMKIYNFGLMYLMYISSVFKTFYWLDDEDIIKDQLMIAPKPKMLMIAPPPPQSEEIQYCIYDITLKKLKKDRKKPSSIDEEFILDMISILLDNIEFFKALCSFLFVKRSISKKKVIQLVNDISKNATTKNLYIFKSLENSINYLQIEDVQEKTSSPQDFNNSQTKSPTPEKKNKSKRYNGSKWSLKDNKWSQILGGKSRKKKHRK